ncbi:Formamidopyrimidine-DNA glycosylase N-terminal domain-containing protein [Thelephora terrestris]|uniref:Formamidopyrimidine-DNA glycosylase N-terminal domain-containing protein n=1 Tax=Thelephora terrestris TaxID=56493 RepID=A0A9P6HK65_9AGAM|nr:Formamidopyrimidine-DNA glycosylase N-terminal domain-containing protein [Thelephora terrestris]
MPELPEVERAAKFIRTIAAGKKITRVETVEDALVYTGGITHDLFRTEIEGRVVRTAERRGKVFYIELEGSGKMPVLHFGMTGMLRLRGQLAMYYKETPKEPDETWPPRYMKFVLHLVDPNDEDADPLELAFLDARRLGRIRLCEEPLNEPPISELGFDPMLSMPNLEDFTPLVLRRKAVIKSVLLDQSFSAGVGNWVADEILYHARIHPEQRACTLSNKQVEKLHFWISEVCKVAVSVDADDTKFPDDWLFRHRWGKGKAGSKFITLPSGKRGTLRWVTVGGRTSAFVGELQKHPNGPVESKMRKGNTSWSSVYLEDDSDYRSEDDSAPPASDEGPTAGATKRKREIVSSGSNANKKQKD